MSIKTPRLIQDRCGVFYFRFIVPVAWRQSVGKTEFRRSLRTKDAGMARVRALELCLAVEGITNSHNINGSMKGDGCMNPKITDFAHLLGKVCTTPAKARVSG